MRPYRGLTKEGKWVYGSHAEVDGKHYIIPKEAKTGLLEGMTFYDLGIYPFTEVIPETVGQFTDLHDKNRTEIADGDIFKSEDRVSRFIIIWSNGSFRGKYPHSGGDGFHFDSFEALRGKIIGNIHTTPELLEQDNE